MIMFCQLLLNLFYDQDLKYIEIITNFMQLSHVFLRYFRRNKVSTGNPRSLSDIQIPI